MEITFCDIQKFEDAICDLQFFAFKFANQGQLNFFLRNLMFNKTSSHGKRAKSLTIPDELVINKIYIIRGQRIMLDRDLAELYQVETRALNQAVKRNIERFPNDFMFQLTHEELENLISQFVTSSWGGIRKLPLAFTEQGVAMLSSILNSETAIKVNIQIIRVFTKMRQLMLDHKDILLQLEKIERKLSSHDQDIV